VVLWAQRWKETGSVAAKPSGGSTSPLEEHAEFLLGLMVKSECTRGSAIQRNLVPESKYCFVNRLFRKLPPGIKSFVRQMTSRSSTASLSLLTGMSRPQGVPVLRCGVIGLGFMGRTHAEVLRQHPYFSLAGIVSRQPEKRKIADELGSRWFESAEEMIASGVVGVIVIATPHWQHAELAVAALRAGLHVVCEKPLAVTAAQADLVLRVAQESKGLLTVVFQSRFEPVYQRAKALLGSGELGSIIRCEMLETFWRSDAYYSSSPWRATWKGEGGGVLLNQAPHVLDRYLWLYGMPKSVTGFCDAALHNIEAEDTASAVLRHEDGRHGYLHVNTTECPWLSRTVIACDRGRITVQNGSMRVERLYGSIQAKTVTSTSLFGDIDSRAEDAGGTLVGSPFELLSRMYENIALAIAGRQPLLITAAEAANAVELANAILLSSASGRSVNLPIDRTAYEAFIFEKIGPSNFLASA
jgi:predicted dehydrogenase